MSTVISSINELIQPSIGFVVDIWNAGISLVSGSADALSSVFLSS